MPSVLDQRVYRSNSLQADFIAQWFHMSVGGRHYKFWGARLVGLSPNSPLWQASVRPGDVITRLDGISIARGMYRNDGGFEIPELERHFGGTEVRHIHHGTNIVQVDWININLYPGEDGDAGVAP
jgi:hypothetical protein